MKRTLVITVLAGIILSFASGTVYSLSLNEALLVTVTGVNGTSFCAPNGTASANVNGGTPPYYYLWNNGGTEAIITNLTAGTYRVTVTDGSSTSATGNVTITNTYPIIVDASSTNETGVNAHDGTAIALPTGGDSPYSFEWSNGSAGFMIVNLIPGVYTVTITDDSGCTASESVIVNAFGCSELSIGSIVVNPQCYGICNGTIQIDAVGNGTPPYSYLWSNGTVGPILTNLCVGYVSVSVTDENGCGAAETYLISQPSQVFAGAMSSGESGPGANDGKAWATPSGGSGSYTYLWSNSSTDSLITGLIPGMYSVTVSDVNSCSATQTVFVNMFGCTILDGNIINASCFGSCDGSITVTLNNPLPPVTYLWDNGSTQSLRTGLCIGSYSVTATDAAGCSASGIFTVTQPFPLNANAGNTDETATDANDGTAWSAPIGGTAPYSYLWSNGSIDSLITNLSPGAYFLTVTDANGCTDLDFALISSFQCIGPHTFTFVQPTCYSSCDGNAMALILGSVSAISYLWSTGDTTNYINNLCAGPYSLTITNENLGCTDESFTFEIQPPDSLIVVVDQITHITDSTSASVSIHGIGGTHPYTFKWTGPGGFTSDLEDISGLGAGTYIVEIVDDHGCTVIDSIQIEDNSTVGIQNQNQLYVRLYPNPARGIVYLEIDKTSGFQIHLYSYDGRIVNTWKDVSIIDVRNIATGIYALRVTSGEKHYIQRLVLEK